MKIASIYCRVSTEGQEREGTSLDSQLEACLKVAGEQGYAVLPEYIFREVWSGADLDRPLLERVRDLVKQREVCSVICYSTDRLTRKAVHIAILAEEWERRGASLVFVTEPLDSSPEGQLIRYVKGYAAEIEREKIRERSLRGKRARAVAGKLPAASHTRLYGYDYDKERGVRTINEEQAYWVRQMFTWVADGASLNKVVLSLRELGVPSPTGLGYWFKSTVAGILKNPAYVGETYAFTVTCAEPDRHVKPNVKNKKTRVIPRPREEWVAIPGATPPIVPHELFEAVQAVLERNRVVHDVGAKRQYLLRGHLFCDQCGRRYIGKAWVSQRRSGKRYERRYYTCGRSHRVDGPERCDNRTVGADEIERIVWEQVEKVLGDPGLVFSEIARLQEKGESCEYWESQLEQVEIRMDALSRRERRLVRAVTFGLEDEQIIAEKASIDKERDLLLKEKDSLQKQLEVAREMKVDVDGVQRYCERVRQNLGKLTFDDKRLALEALNVKVVIGKNGLVLRGVVPVLSPSSSISLSGDRDAFRSETA